MEQKIILAELAKDTLIGLSANPKYLLSKYFYDDTGSAIFQKIMNMPEYYLTNCEHEIFTQQKKQIIEAFLKETKGFDLIELGPGDGLKTKILLNTMAQGAIPFNYIPIDISKKANIGLVKSLAEEIPDLNVKAQTGDFFKVMKMLNGHSSLRRIVLFLGSNIGNFSEEETDTFLGQISEFTQKGDKVLIGFDLIKSPEIIIKAYDDPHGFTKDFILNHLARLNRELDANFNLSDFSQHTSYNPQTGAVKNYLISKVDQKVTIGGLEKSFHFKKWESIFMELSQKFELETINKLAFQHGFRVEKHFTDSRNYFVDSLWERR